MTITESIKFDKLKEENQELKNKLAEKDKEIELMNEQCDGAIKELQQTQLYKEDFIIGENHNGSIETYEEDNTFYTDDIKYVLKDNSKYNKLHSKDVK